MSVSLLEQKCLSQTLRREIWPRSKTITYTRLKKKETSHHDFSSCKWTAALQSPYNMWVASDFCACMVWESGLRGPSPRIIKAKCREVQALTGFGEYDSPPQVINCDTPPGPYTSAEPRKVSGGSLPYVQPGESPRSTRMRALSQTPACKSKTPVLAASRATARAARAFRFAC